MPVKPDLNIFNFVCWRAKKSILPMVLFIIVCLASLCLGSLSVVIVSLIDINNWPYLRINNFQLMDQTRSMA